MRKKYPKINIITVNFNGKKHLKMLFNSLAKLNYPKDKFRIICVDNVSTDGSVSWIRKNYPKVRIILNDVNNYCKANNLGIKNSDTEFVALVNNDTRVDKDWLIELVKVISQDKKIAGVGSKILTLKGRIQNAGHYELPNFYWGERGAGEENNKYDAIEEISSLCGAAVLYRRSSLLEVGLFDEDFIIYGEDVDISLRLRQKKYKLVFAPQSIVSHRFHGTADQGSSRFYIERNRLLYVAKHYPQQLSAALIGDGYFTVKNSIESLSNLYLVLPEIIMKLVKVHSWDLVKGVVQKLFNEIKKISNLEKDILITKFNAMADDQRKVNIELNEKKVELIQQKAMIEEINKVRLMQEGQKKKQAAEKKIQEEQNRLQNKSTQPKITQLNDFIKSLGEKLRLRIEEVFSKDQQLVERKNEIEFLKKELASLVEQLANSLVAAEENKSLLEIKENDIIGYKEELQNLSGQLRQRMDEVLIKDGKLVEAEEKISSLDAEFLNLSKQLCERIEEIALQDKQLAEQDNAISSLQAGAVAKDSRLMEQEHKINSLDSELQNLSGQLRQRIEEILIKDDNLAQAGEKITYLDSELQNLSGQLRQRMDEVLIKDGKLVEAEEKISSLDAEILNLSKQLCERIEEIALQDKQLAEQANAISSLQAAAIAKDNKITLLDSELQNLSGQLRQRMDEVLIKDGKLVEADVRASALDVKLLNLSKQLCERIEEIALQDKQLAEQDNTISSLQAGAVAKDSRLMEQEHKINSLDSELQNLSGQLRQRIEEILIKDDNLAQAGEKITYLDTELLNLSKQLCERIEEIALQDKQLAEQANTISSLQAGAVAKDSRLMEQEHKINSLDTELSGIYKSEGYRFILRPFWTLLWNTRGLAREISKKFTQAFWFTTAIALTPVFLFLVACFLIENILGYFLGPLLRRIAAKRKIRSIRDSKVSLVIPNYNGVTYLKECLPSVFAATGFSDGQNEVLVVDDGSKDGSVEFIRENFPGVRLLKNRKNRGFGFTCNRGVKAAKHEIIVLINNDIILTKDFLNPLLRHLQRSEDVFTATPKLYGWDRKTFAWGMHMGHFEKGYIRLWNESEIGSGDKISEASPSIFAIGGAMVFRREDFLWLGGFDAIYRPNCWEDIDISYRAWKRGLKVVYEPSSLMYHKGRATLTYERPKEIKNELLFTWKNITDKQILKEHLNLLPWNLYRNRRPFLKGFFWAINHLPQTLLHRLLERGHILEPEDRKIFNKIMLYYGNFIKRGLNHPSGAKPNILIVSRFLPYPLNMGGRIRIHNLVKSLTDRYNFILLSLIDHRDELAYLPALKEIFTEVYPVHTKSPLGLDFSLRMFYPEQYKHGYSYSQELVDKLKELKETKPIDIIHIESNELLYLVDSAGCLPIVYTEHDSSIFSLGKSYYKKDNQFFWPLLDNLKRIYFHHTQFNKLNKVITLSKRDEYILRRFFPKAEITLVPTGVDLKHFAFKDNAGKTKKLIFVGHYRHYPNEDAAVYFVNKIFPLIRKAMPEVELLLVGSHPTARVENLTQEDNVVLVGQVEDVQPYLNDAAVFVNSIRISAGIKGKVLEAMASGVPVVSTTVGSSGIDARDGEEILIADTPKEFARQVIKLLKDKELRANLIANARDLVENKYSWIKIVSKLDRVYKSLLFDAGYDYPNFYLSEKIIDTTNNLIEHKIEALDDDFVHPEAGPEELHIELTYNCNSKCIMCDLWDHNQRSTKSNRELSLDEIRSFVGESRLLQKSKVVVLSGGEPFLRNDIVDLCGYFSRQIPHSSLGILTNGINTEVILNKTKDVLNRFQPQSLWLGSSLDGLGKEHDKIRGVPGAFSGLCKTINQCKKELPQVKFSVTFTLTPYNIDQLVPAKHFADSEGLDFFAQFVVPKQAREEFIWTPQDLDRADKEIMQIIQEIIAKMGQGANLATIGKIKDQYLVSQLYYWSHLVKYQTNPQRFFKKCVAGAKFAMFNPYGDCYFCPGHKNNAIGNIRQQKFDQLWMSEKAQHMRSFIDGNNCHCWLVCTVFPVLEKALSKC